MESFNESYIDKYNFSPFRSSCKACNDEKGNGNDGNIIKRVRSIVNFEIHRPNIKTNRFGKRQLRRRRGTKSILPKTPQNPEANNSLKLRDQKHYLDDSDLLVIKKQLQDIGQYSPDVADGNYLNVDFFILYIIDRFDM